MRLKLWSLTLLDHQNIPKPIPHCSNFVKIVFWAWWGVFCIGSKNFFYKKVFYRSKEPESRWVSPKSKICILSPMTTYKVRNYFWKALYFICFFFSEIEARKVAANLGCEAYIESSSLTQKNLKEVFDNAIVEGLRFRSIREQKSAGKGKGKKHKKCEILW